MIHIYMGVSYENVSTRHVSSCLAFITKYQGFRKKLYRIKTTTTGFDLIQKVYQSGELKSADGYHIANNLRSQIRIRVSTKVVRISSCSSKFHA